MLFLICHLVTLELLLSFLYLVIAEKGDAIVKESEAVVT